MSAVPPQVLAVDLGTSGMKLALVGHDGQVIGWEAEPIDLLLLPGGGAEQVPQQWWDAFGACAARLAARHPVQFRAVTTVCCSTQGEGTIAIDANGEPLTNAILWMDMRGAANLRRHFGGRPAINGLSAARHARWVRLTGGAPSPTGKDPSAHMLWVRDELPEIYERTAVFLNVLDYLNLRLTGRTVATVDSILTSWVTDNRNPSRIRYDAALVAGSGIDADKLPPIVACTDVIGTLTPAAAEHLGLLTSVQVVAGAIDNTAAAIGAGTIDNGDCHLYLGTSSWIAGHVPAKKTDVLHGIASVPCALPDRYLLTALQATAAGNLNWLRDNVVGPGDPMVAADVRGEFFTLADRLLPGIPAGANGVLYLPWIFGERAPVDDQSLRAGLLNISLHNTRGDLLRAVFEGIALNTRWMLNPVNKFLGRPVESLRLIGGGARSDSWTQILADVLGVRIDRVEDPVAANARGAGLIGAIGTGALAASDIPALVRIADVHEPDPRVRGIYDESFEIFVEAHRRLGPFYRRIARRH
ncbi:MAG: xylulose kinase [Actinobacteria bacterium HGW-Actinobacteria-2]|nr:MAG: xylulose kinase [Actinobacteria bacterium HGW-Actinobacteria-2]